MPTSDTRLDDAPRGVLGSLGRPIAIAGAAVGGAVALRAILARRKETRRSRPAKTRASSRARINEADERQRGEPFELADALRRAAVDVAVSLIDRATTRLER
jgi:hypothetical protein